MADFPLPTLCHPPLVFLQAPDPLDQAGSAPNFSWLGPSSCPTAAVGFNQKNTCRQEIHPIRFWSQIVPRCPKGISLYRALSISVYYPQLPSGTQAIPNHGLLKNPPVSNQWSSLQKIALGFRHFPPFRPGLCCWSTGLSVRPRRTSVGQRPTIGVVTVRVAF